MSQGPDTSSLAADAMRRFGEAITAAGGGDDLALSTPIAATAISLYESLYGELSLHMPELPEERREYLAEFMVRRVVRDHSDETCSEPGCRSLAVSAGRCTVHEISA